jgi:hypothetical protein
MAVRLREIGVWIACYLLWACFAAAGLVLLILLRETMLTVARRLSDNAYAVGSVDRWGTLLLGLTWLAVVVILESYLRGGVVPGRLLNRAWRVTVWLAIVAIAALLTQNLA